MKLYKPTIRLLDITKVLQYDSEKQDIGRLPIFTVVERIFINQERGKIMSGDFTFLQNQDLENKILAVLLKIEQCNWEREFKQVYITFYQ